jgi:hypothetical protein
MIRECADQDQLLMIRIKLNILYIDRHDKIWTILILSRYGFSRGSLRFFYLSGGRIDVSRLSESTIYCQISIFKTTVFP